MLGYKVHPLPTYQFSKINYLACQPGLIYIAYQFSRSCRGTPLAWVYWSGTYHSLPHTFKSSSISWAYAPLNFPPYHLQKSFLAWGSKHCCQVMFAGPPHPPYLHSISSTLVHSGRQFHTSVQLTQILPCLCLPLSWATLSGPTQPGSSFFQLGSS